VYSYAKKGNATWPSPFVTCKQSDGYSVREQWLWCQKVTVTALKSEGNVVWE
jgi:hypothetical protein